MVSKMIVVGSSCEGYKTAANYLTKTRLGSAAMAFFPHIQPHLIRNSIRHLGKAFGEIRDGTIISPGNFYVGAQKNFEVDKFGYSSGLNRKFSIQQQGHRGYFRVSSQMSNDPIDDAFIAVYHQFKKNTICVILRGAGTDGVESARHIHENGGEVIIESLIGGMTEYARYKIPDAEVLAPKDIPEKLEELINTK